MSSIDELKKAYFDNILHDFAELQNSVVETQIKIDLLNKKLDDEIKSKSYTYVKNEVNESLSDLSKLIESHKSDFQSSIRLILQSELSANIDVLKIKKNWKFKFLFLVVLVGFLSGITSAYFSYVVYTENLRQYADIGRAVSNHWNSFDDGVKGSIQKAVSNQK